MIQVFPKCVANVGYGAAAQHTGVCDGNGIMTLDIGKAPMPTSGTLRKLSVYCGVAHPDVKVDIFIDGASSGLSLTLGSHETQVADLLTEVVYAAGQTVSYRTLTTLQLFPGFEMAFCVELEADALSFCVTAAAGGASYLTTHYGGAFGNGYWADNRSSQSITALAGSATRLAIRRFSSNTGGSWKAWLEIDTVLQDGTGGTVDTLVELDDTGAAVAFRDFDLPCMPVQHVNVVLVRDTEPTFAIEQVGVGVAFVPSDPDGFMLVGGSNDIIPIPGTSWKWNHSRESGASMAMHEAPISGRSIRLTGLYVERTVPPTAGESFTHTILRNGIASNISVVIADNATTGVGFGEQICRVDDLVTIELVSTAGANPVAKFYWALVGQVSGGVGVIGPLLWWRFRRRVPTL